MEGKWGFIDAAGKVVIQPRFLDVGEFSEGLAKVTVLGLTDEDRMFERNASGFIDEGGRFLIGPGSPPGYEFPEHRNDYSYGDFHDGLARFWVGDATGLGGYIDRTGKLAIPPRYAEASDFSQGLACVSLPRLDGSPFGPKLAGFIDHNGEFAIPADREYIATGFSEGLCVISVQDSEGKWHPSVIDLRGKTVVSPHIYTQISDFTGGLSRVVKDGKVGCINTAGEIVIPLEFDQLSEFGNSELTAGEKDGKKSIVDRTGQCVKEISLGQGAYLGSLQSGLAIVESQDKIGYISAEGELVIPTRFDRGEDFSGALAYVEMDEFRGYIDQHGEFVWNTDRWDEPIRNEVVKPLSEFLPPNCVESLPLEYNWQGVENAIVFASNTRFESLPSWFTEAFANRYEVIDDSDEPGQIDIRFSGDNLSGSLHAIDATSDETVEGFIGFYASKNMELLMERHEPIVLGILILEH